MKKQITFFLILLIITMFSVCTCTAEAAFPYDRPDGGGTGITEAGGAEEYCLPGQSERTLWDNPRTTHDGTPIIIRPGERVTVVSIQGCGVIRKLWMSMNYVGKELYPRAREQLLLL